MVGWSASLNSDTTRSLGSGRAGMLAASSCSNAGREPTELSMWLEDRTHPVGQCYKKGILDRKAAKPEKESADPIIKGTHVDSCNASACIIRQGVRQNHNPDSWLWPRDSSLDKYLLTVCPSSDWYSCPV